MTRPLCRQRATPLILGLILAFPFVAGSSARAEARPGPVIVDTDMAFDDWLALYVVARTSDVSLITIAASGETYCEAGRANAAYVVKLAERAAPRIACGASEPSNGYHAFPTPWRIDSSRMAARDDSQRDSSPEPTGPAWEELAAALKRAQTPVKILALGPLTNIAEVLTRAPSVAPKIDALYVMGGAVGVPGNIRVPGFTERSKNAVSEWNFYVDPAAAATVLRANVKTILVPLDATRFAPVDLAFLQPLAALKSPAAAFFRRAFSPMSAQIRAGQLFFWDAAAAMCLIEPSLCHTRDERIRVVETLQDPACAAKSLRCPYLETTAGALVRDPRARATSYVDVLDGARLRGSLLKLLSEAN